MSYNYDTYPCGHSKYGYLVKRNQGGASLLSRRVYGNKFFADSLEDVLNDNRIRYYELKQVIKSGDDLYLVNLFDLGDDLASIRKSLQSLLLCRINVILITPDNNELELSRCRREIMYILDLAASFISQQNQQSKCMRGIKSMPTDSDGFRVSKRTGRRIGRPRVNYPDNWESIVAELDKGSITASQAMQKMGMKKTSFYKLLKEHRNKKL